MLQSLQVGPSLRNLLATRVKQKGKKMPGNDNYSSPSATIKNHQWHRYFRAVPGQAFGTVENIDFDQCLCSLARWHGLKNGGLRSDLPLTRGYGATSRCDRAETK